MRYKTITITPPTADLSGQLVRIKIDADADIGAVSAASGYDVYFTNSTGAALLPFSRLEWTISNGKASGAFDVLCDIPVAGLTLRVYYGGEAFTDYQNRSVTYAGYLAVYPCISIQNGNTIEDISGNGKHVTIPANLDVHVYESPTNGKMLQATSTVNTVATSTVNMAYEGDVSMSCVTEAPHVANDWQRLPAPNGYVPNGSTFLRRFGSSTSGVDLLAYNAGVASYINFGEEINYVCYQVLQTTGTCIYRGNGSKGFLTSTFSKTWTRIDNVTIFPSGSAKGGQVRDVRYRKGAVSLDSGKFEKDSLVGNVATFGSEVQLNSPRRRHIQILEAF